MRTHTQGRASIHTSKCTWRMTSASAALRSRVSRIQGSSLASVHHSTSCGGVARQHTQGNGRVHVGQTRRVTAPSTQEPDGQALAKSTHLLRGNTCQSTSATSLAAPRKNSLIGWKQERLHAPGSWGAGSTGPAWRTGCARRPSRCCRRAAGTALPGLPPSAACACRCRACPTHSSSAGTPARGRVSSRHISMWVGARLHTLVVFSGKHASIRALASRHTAWPFVCSIVP